MKQIESNQSYTIRWIELIDDCNSSSLGDNFIDVITKILHYNSELKITQIPHSTLVKILSIINKPNHIKCSVCERTVHLILNYFSQTENVIKLSMEEEPIINVKVKPPVELVESISPTPPSIQLTDYPKLPPTVHGDCLSLSGKVGMTNFSHFNYHTLGILPSDLANEITQWYVNEDPLSHQVHPNLKFPGGASMQNVGCVLASYFTAATLGSYDDSVSAIRFRKMMTKLTKEGLISGNLTSTEAVQSMSPEHINPSLLSTSKHHPYVWNNEVVFNPFSLSELVMIRQMQTHNNTFSKFSVVSLMYLIHAISLMINSNTSIPKNAFTENIIESKKNETLTMSQVYGVVKDPVLIKAVEDASVESNIDAALILAVIKQESDFDVFAKGSSNDIGLMQITPAAASDVGKQWSYDIGENISAGTAYLSKMIHLFGSIRYGISAYNVGPNGVKKGGVIPNPKYVNNVLRNWKNYQSYSFSVSNSLKYNLSFSMKFIQALLFMNVDDIIKGSDTLLNFVRSMFNVQKFDKIFPTDKASILIQDLLRFIHDISSTKTYSFVIFGKGRDFMQHMVLGSRFPLFNRLALRNVGYSSCNQAVIKTKFDEPDQYAVIYAHILGTLEYQRWSRKVGYKLNDETSCFSEFKFTEFIKKFNALSNDHSRVLKKFFSDLGWRQLI